MPAFIVDNQTKQNHFYGKRSQIFSNYLRHILLIRRHVHWWKRCFILNVWNYISKIKSEIKVKLNWFHFCFPTFLIDWWKHLQSSFCTILKNVIWVKKIILLQIKRCYLIWFQINRRKSYSNFRYILVNTIFILTLYLKS